MLFYTKNISSSSSPSNTVYFFFIFFLHDSIINPRPSDLSKERKTRILIFPKKTLKLSHRFAEPPVFTSTPATSITAQNGGTIRLNCSAKGSPLPRITWYKDSVIINSTTIMSRNEVKSEIEINHFGLLDQGTYTCIARNEYNDKINKAARVGE